MGNIEVIPNFPGYFVTKEGKIWSSKTHRWLTPDVSYNERLRVTLYRNNKPHKKLVHRLVLETFIGPCPEGMEGCHNNGNSLDNSLLNLRWDTRQNNAQDAIKHKTHCCLRRGESSMNAKLNELQVRIIRRLLEFGMLYQREIGEVFNVCQELISCIKTRKYWSHI